MRALFCRAVWASSPREERTVGPGARICPSIGDGAVWGTEERKRFSWGYDFFMFVRRGTDTDSTGSAIENFGENTYPEKRPESHDHMEEGVQHTYWKSCIIGNIIVFWMWK